MDRFISTHLQGVSRTYALLIPMLPRELSEAVGLAYLLMRVIDTFEDAPQLSNTQRATHLVSLDGALQGGGDLPDELRAPIGDALAEHALMHDANIVLQRIRDLPPAYREATIACGREMIAGVLQMLQRSAAREAEYPAIRNATELRDYCYYVAGVVGIMLCDMMAHYLGQPALRRLRELAVELGIGLQMVNILKDALKDARAGRRYLPHADDTQIDAAEIYRFALAEARVSLRKGVDFVLALPAAAKELRCFCGLPIAWGAMTLARAERDQGRGKVGRGAIRSSIELFGKLSGDDDALRRWFAQLLPAQG